MKQTREGLQQDGDSLWEELETKKIFYYPLTNLVEEERVRAQRKIEKRNTIQTKKNFRSKGKFSIGFQITSALLHFLEYTTTNLKYGKRGMDSLSSLKKSQADSFIYVSRIQTNAYLFSLVYKTNSTRGKILQEMLKIHSESLSQGDQLPSTEWIEE